MNGRFAPSPTGRFHVGNLRTALVAWLFARSAGSRFLIRMEDLDPVTSRVGHAAGQLADLAAIGLDWNGDVLWQSKQTERYADAFNRLRDAGLVYQCYCTRREIQDATRAPNGPATEIRYPGTCRDLTAAECRSREAAGRRAAYRLRTNGEKVGFEDAIVGNVVGDVDDIVLRRNDGVHAYNLAVVVDDAWQGVEQVVRADDLVPSTPSQLHLIGLLGLAVPSYAHVPLVVGATGERLAKRDGAVTLPDLARMGMSPDDVLNRLGASLGLEHDGRPAARPSPVRWLESFVPDRLPTTPLVWTG